MYHSTARWFRGWSRVSTSFASSLNEPPKAKTQAWKVFPAPYRFQGTIPRRSISPPCSRVSWGIIRSRASIVSGPFSASSPAARKCPLFQCRTKSALAYRGRNQVLPVKLMFCHRGAGKSSARRRSRLKRSSTACSSPVADQLVTCAGARVALAGGDPPERAAVSFGTRSVGVTTTSTAQPVFPAPKSLARVFMASPCTDPAVKADQISRRSAQPGAGAAPG